MDNNVLMFFIALPYTFLKIILIQDIEWPANTEFLFGFYYNPLKFDGILTDFFANLWHCLTA